LKIADLTTEERVHVKNGGRVFLIEEIPGPLWRILSLSKKGVVTLCKPEIPTPKEGYSDLEIAKNLAYGISALSEDSPMVRVCTPQEN
jgi:hypothetical protein